MGDPRNPQASPSTPRQPPQPSAIHNPPSAIGHLRSAICDPPSAFSIGGFVPLSLCDFPGTIAAVVFTTGCNFRCPFCHNGHLLDADGSPPLDTEAVLDRLSGLASRLGGVVISGGEPTLQPGLALFLDAAKALGLAVKLDTNGSHPDVLEALLDHRLLDFVAMDIKAPWHKYEVLTGVSCETARLQRSMRLIARSGLPHEFRTTAVTPLLTEADRSEIRGQIPAGSHHRWQDFRPEHSLDPKLRAISRQKCNTSGVV